MRRPKETANTVGLNRNYTALNIWWRAAASTSRNGPKRPKTAVFGVFLRGSARPAAWRGARPVAQACYGSRAQGSNTLVYVRARLEGGPTLRLSVCRSPATGDRPLRSEVRAIEMARECGANVATSTAAGLRWSASSLACGSGAGGGLARGVSGDSTAAESGMRAAAAGCGGVCCAPASALAPPGPHLTLAAEPPRADTHWASRDTSWQPPGRPLASPG